MKWFSSDLHWGYRNIVSYTNRGVDTTQEEHDEWLVNLWNSQVKPGHTLYHLGDFSFHKNPKKTLELIDRLNGQIVMIKGNHDHSDMFKEYAKHPKVIEAVHYKEMKVAGVNTCLFHFPIAAWNRQHHGAYCIHGHSHGSYTPEHGKILDVGLDNAYNVLGQHRFFTEDDIKTYMGKRSIYVADQHTKREGDM